LVMAHGAVDEVERAKAIFNSAQPSKLAVHLYENELKRSPAFAEV